MTVTHNFLSHFLPFQMESYSTSAATFVLDGAADGYGCIFHAFTTEAITKVMFQVTATGGTPPAYYLGLQGVTTAGVPDGVWKGGSGTEARVSVTPTGAGILQGTLVNSYTPSFGEPLAAVVVYDSDTGDTINASNDITVRRQHNTYHMARPNPAITAGSWSGSANMGSFGIATASRSYGMCWNSVTTQAVSTTGHRVATRFNLPAGYGDTFKCAGMMVSTNQDTVDWKAGIWEGTTEQASKTIDEDVAGTNTWHYILFDSEVELNYGTEYRIGLESTTGSSLNFGSWDCDHSDAADTFYDGQLKLSTYNGTSWSDDDTIIGWCYPLLSDITEPAGGGGGMIRLGWDGGFSG